jgi:hypothetical protein
MADSFVLDSGLEVRLVAVEAPRVRPGDIWGPKGHTGFGTPNFRQNG